MRHRLIHPLSVTLLCLMLLANAWGCAKKVASSSGDTSSVTKGKNAAAPVETIKPEGMVTIPEEQRSTIDTARAPVDTPPVAGADSPSPLAPASLTMEESASLGDIFFDCDEYTIRRDAQTVLEVDALWIKNAVGKSVLIEGHCDER